MRNWLMDNAVTELSVVLWFRQSGASEGLVGLVSNGDCIEDATFFIYLRHTGGDDYIVAGVITEVGQTAVVECRYVRETETDVPYNVM